LRFLKVFFCTETEHESTTQKHMKNIPYMARRILLKTNLQWAKEKYTVWKNKNENGESHRSQLKFKYEVYLVNNTKFKKKL